ncbi:hypothetical protein Msi02_31200 [Microbispora siamensis]|uniref:Uncharacterized protein n=1 Tax=Microbispora siamensis TaxID=564413 RepID=A0ABQ4GLJ8_9ACTN|nr:hypothetical protein Msi02_31200 [Microbispora siamensis]
MQHEVNAAEDGQRRERCGIFRDEGTDTGRDDEGHARVAEHEPAHGRDHGPVAQPRAERERPVRSRHDDQQQGDTPEGDGDSSAS